MVNVEIDPDTETREIVAIIELGGQPDAIDVSPDGRYAAVAIENERDEGLCVGGEFNGGEIVDDETEALCEDGGGVPSGLLQIEFGNPAGKLVIITLDGAPKNWAVKDVELQGFADLYPSDPEPEYVDINEDNLAVVTLQENNHLVLVDLETGRVEGEFPAMTANLRRVDATENRLIEQKGVA